MKKLLFLSATLMLLTTVAFAQNKKGAHVHKHAEERAHFINERMMVRLNLNKEQTDKIQALNLNRAKRIEDIKSQHGISKEDVRTQVKMLHDEYNNEVKSILTPEQYQQYMNIRDEQREKVMQRRGHHEHRKHAGKQAAE